METTKNLVKENSLCLIQIPEVVYSLLDYNKIDMGSPSIKLGEITIIDEKSIEFKINPILYRFLDDGPDPDDYPLVFRARIVDATKKNLFLFSERSCKYKIQGRINLKACLIPTVLHNFNHYHDGMHVKKRQTLKTYVDEKNDYVK